MDKRLYDLYCRSYQKMMKAAVNLLKWEEPQLLKGAGSVKKLPGLISKLGFKSVLVVTDAVLNQKLHLLDGMLEEMKKSGINYIIYDGVQQNPTIDNIEQARALYVGNGCEAIVAFGGGSPMDCAKACGARVARPEKTIPQLRGQLKVIKDIPMLFAIPTTAGTGSETTIAAVVTDPRTHEKYAINDTKLRPKYAVLDPELTVGLPPKITAATGMDALTHAVEAYIGQSNTKQTAEYARKAVRMIFDNLYNVYKDGNDIVGRENMLLASYYAGVAFTRAYVGYVHSIAHNLGGMYGVPHGFANAVILPHVLDYYGDSCYKQLAELFDVAGLNGAGKSEAEKAKSFIDEIKRLNERMEIPETFDFIKEEDVSIIADRALKEGNPLYPVPKIMDKADCVSVIHGLMK